MKNFVCDCVNPNYEELNIKDINEFIEFIDESEEINKKKFLDECEVEDVLKKEIKKFPNDFRFCRNEEIYFYTHSMIECFFK